MGERELEVLGDELADVRALDVLGLLELDDAEDLAAVSVLFLPVKFRSGFRRTWMDLKRARWRAAMSE